MNDLTPLFTCPAFDVIEPLKKRASDDVIMSHGLRFYWIEGSKEYVAGSAVGYALEYNNDPIAAYNRCVERGEPAHWLGPVGATITAHKRDRRVLYAIKPGDTVMFEGRRFLVEKAPNHNMNLKPITEGEG